MHPRRVITPVFEIASNPTVKLTDIKSRHYGRPRMCPVCGERFMDLPYHVSSMGDDAHGVLEVMDL